MILRIIKDSICRSIFRIYSTVNINDTRDIWNITRTCNFLLSHKKLTVSSILNLYTPSFVLLRYIRSFHFIAILNGDYFIAYISMVARKIENLYDIRACIKGRTLLGIGAKSIYKELSYINWRCRTVKDWRWPKIRETENWCNKK